jgi:cell division protein FtsB
MSCGIGLVLRCGLLYCVRVAQQESASILRRRAPAPSTPRPGRSRRIVYLLILFVASLIVLDSLVGDRGLVAIWRARQEYDQLSAAITWQRGENARLRDEIRRLREDPATIEEIARRELGLIRPGERIFIVKDAPAPTR